MKATARILIVIVSTALLGVATPNGGAEPVEDPAGIHGADAELAVVISGSIDRFNSTGLDLEPLRVYVHPTDEGCSGYQARFSTDGEVDRVDLCTGRTPHIVLHELGHAWAHHNLTEEERQTFLDQTGLTWNDPDVDWRRRGIEVIANTIAWGLRDAPLTSTDARNHPELLRLFELVTGIASPRLLTADT